MTQKHYNIPVFIPELACPFQCVFCNQQKITGHHQVPGDDEIVQTIEAHFKTFKAVNPHVEVGFFGGSFTGLPITQQAHFLSLVKPFLDEGKVDGIRLSTRPDYIDTGILEMLKSKGVTTIELGAQSLVNEVLSASFRGHTVEQTEKASALILSHGIDLGLQMMIGLPGDSLERALVTANRIVDLGASSTRIYPTVVIRDTALHNWYKKGTYKPLSMPEAVEWTKNIIPVFEKAGVTILRTGLHPSEGLTDGSELVTGPFHPSFKELVMTEIWADLLKPLLKSNKSREVVIRVPPRELNYAVGYRAANRKMLMKKIDSVRFVADRSITGRKNFQVLLSG